MRRIVSLAVLAALLGFLLPQLVVVPPSGPPPPAPAESQPPAAESPPETAVLPDISPDMSTRERKEVFFGFLLPLVQEENRRLAERRERLRYIQEHLYSGRDLIPADREWLEGIRQRYAVDLENYHHPDFWALLLERVDQIPEDLVLIQAANESAWGTSRFAREGNNLFGQWCFRPGCGMVPEGRPDGEIYEVARFSSPAASVASYMHNLNMGHAYEELRRIRAALRAAGVPVSPGALAVGLGRYSQRGQEYVRELQAMLRVNKRLISTIRLRLNLKKEA